MNETGFAQGLCFYKLFMVFAIGAFLGNLVETVFCRIKFKKWTNRSSFVYSQISIVWGMAMVLATLLFYKMDDRDVVNVFVVGTILGGIYEYVCSLLSEKCFGVVFWDYSKFRFNLAGRVNLKYCFLWGAASILWMYWIFPVLERGIEQMPIMAGTAVCNFLIIFFALDGLISALALSRYVERNDENASQYMKKNRFWNYIDRHFPDERIRKVYPCMKKSQPRTYKVKGKEHLCGV